MHVQACGRTDCIVSCSNSSKSKQNAYLSMHFLLFLSLFPFSGLVCRRAIFPPVSLLLQMKSRDFLTLGKLFTLYPHPLSFNPNTDSVTVDSNLMSYGKSPCKAFESNSLLVLFSILLCSLRDLSYFSKRTVIRKTYVLKFLAFLLLFYWCQ